MHLSLVWVRRAYGLTAHLWHHLEERDAIAYSLAMLEQTKIFVWPSWPLSARVRPSNFIVTFLRQSHPRARAEVSSPSAFRLHQVCIFIVYLWIGDIIVMFVVIVNRCTHSIWTSPIDKFTLTLTRSLAPITCSPDMATPTLCQPSTASADLYSEPAGGGGGACSSGGADCSGKKIGLASSHLALGTVEQWTDGEAVCVPLWAGRSIERVIQEVRVSPPPHTHTHTLTIL